ncbi:hypothetical protein DUF1292 [Acetobacterium woodii DSM 1030]|uniref:Uncharacterized protein n=2 Tax=Acetobacterium woodii TaxID=33952 RepID=H6LCJ2_ACEWD|nr:hypothetical protein DUF1292 [Acetobacterium woodii DSM 1030]
MNSLSIKRYNLKIMSGKNIIEREVDMEEKIMLVDDTGVEREFELVVSFDIEDKTYVLLSENEESDDVFPFVVTEDEEGEVLMPVEDEAEFELVAAAYDEIMDAEDYEDEEDADEEDETE